MVSVSCFLVFFLVIFSFFFFVVTVVVDVEKIRVAAKQQVLLILHLVRFRLVIVHAEAFTVPRDKDRFERDAVFCQNVSQFLVRAGNDGETLTVAVAAALVVVVVVVNTTIIIIIVFFLLRLFRTKVAAAAAAGGATTTPITTTV